MNNNKQVLKQLNTMVLLTIITQVFILIKSAIVAFYFGISMELDAFNLANRVSTFIFSFIGAGVSTVIIPYLKDRVNKKAINIFISVIYTIGFLLLILMVIFNQEIIIIANGADSNYFIALAANILIFTALTNFINSLIQLAKGILEFNDRFNIQKLIVLFSNFILVIMLILGNNSIYYYSFIILFITIINLVFHIFFIKKTTFRYTISYDLKNQSFKEMIKLFIPTMLSTGVYQTSLLIDTLIAARLPIGSISILNYSNAVISMINLLLLRNITSFVYPKLVKKTNEYEKQLSLINYIVLVNALMCLLVLLFYSSGREGISVLFERGQFSSEDTKIVFLVSLILTLSLPTNAVRDLLYRYFYMSKDTITPFINSVMISVVNIAVSITLSLYLGLFGVVIGTVVASYFSLFFISFKFKRKFLIHFNIRTFLFENSKILLTTVISLVISMIFKDFINIERTFISLMINAIFSLAIFTVLLKLLKSRIFQLKL